MVEREVPQEEQGGAGATNQNRRWALLEPGLAAEAAGEEQHQEQGVLLQAQRPWEKRMGLLVLVSLASRPSHLEDVVVPWCQTGCLRAASRYHRQDGHHLHLQKSQNRILRQTNRLPRDVHGTCVPKVLHR